MDRPASIALHPAVASNPALLRLLEQLTGLRAVTGRRFAVLAPTAVVIPIRQEVPHGR